LEKRSSLIYKHANKAHGHPTVGFVFAIVRGTFKTCKPDN
jgi:hypothetical protein